MKILILSLFFLVACKTPSTEDFNPMDSYFKLDLSQATSIAGMQTEYMEIVNDHRSTYGLPEFLHHDDIQEEAQKHAESMAMGKVPFGTSGSGERCERIKTAMGMGELCGELVAKGPDNGPAVYTVWMNSPTSRAKIESLKFTHSAIAMAKNQGGDQYWVQIFVEVP